YPDGWTLAVLGRAFGPVVFARVGGGLPMKGAPQWLAVVVAGLLLAGLVGCSGSGGKDGEDSFKPPPSSGAPLPPVRTKFKLRARLKGHQHPPQGVAISPDGKLAVSAGDRALHVWSIPEAKELRTIAVAPKDPPHGGTFNALFFP